MMAKDCKTFIKKKTGVLHGITKYLSLKVTSLYSSLVKSDRINALRKQYEAFLEDDKKRKERNEYILGKLNNMRTCSAVVPHQRSRPNVFPENRENPFQRPAIVTERNLGYNTPSLRSKEQSSDNLLVKDIVQKYILIPKRSSVIDNDYAVDDCVSNTAIIKKDNDWQSKYDILKKLKKNELEEPIDVPLKEKHLLNYYEPQLSMIDQKVKSKGNLNTPIKQLPLERDQVLPEKDLSHSKPGYKYSEKPKDEKSRLHLNQTQEINIEKGDNEFDTGTDKSETNKLQPDIELRENKPIDEKQSFVVKDAYGEKTDLNIKKYNLNVAGKIPEYIEKTNIDNKFEKNYEQEYESANVIDNFENTQNAIHHTDDWNPIEVDTPDLAPKETNNEPVVGDNSMLAKESEYADDWNPADVNTPDLAPKETYNEPVVGDNSIHAKESEYVNETYNEPVVGNNSFAKESEYPIDIINVQKFTPHDNVALHDGVNINPESGPTPNLNDTAVLNNESQMVPDSNQVSDPATAGLTGTEELEEEQKMFYQETANENMYQEGVGDASNPGYAENENYQQNEQYPYYEGGVQPELPPAEVNEYEETSTRYDQNYEQQYANTYEQGYVQQPEGYEQYTEGYVQPESYDQPQEYEQPPQGYEQHPQGYDQHPDGYVEHPQQEGYDQQYQQQNYEAPDKIEQELDNEQGYIEKDEVVEEKPDVQEKREEKRSE